MEAAPIALFVYNRPSHTQKTVESLLRNIHAPESDLYIFSDGPKNGKAAGQVAEVRKYISGISGFKSIEILLSDRNKGLAESIIGGVSHVLSERQTVIVVEDDLVTSPYFLSYMNQALRLYEDEERVISIHGYIYPVKDALPETFFLKGADCWGWATWRRGWKIFNGDGNYLLGQLETKGLTREFDFDGRYPYTRMLRNQIRGVNDSWAIRWYASAFLENKLTLYPGRSLVNNIGNDLSGRHSWEADRWNTLITDKVIVPGPIPLEEDGRAKRLIGEYFKLSAPPLYKKVMNKVRSFFR